MTAAQSIMSFIPSKSTTATIAGMSLTCDQAHFLLESCNSLSQTIHRQNTAVQDLLAVSERLFLTNLETIQTRQKRLKSDLTTLIHHLRKSTEPRLKELGEYRKVMDGKIKQCNRTARKEGVGWKKAEREFWPLMSVTYEFLLLLLGRLIKELRDALDNEGLWTRRRSWMPSVDFGSGGYQPGVKAQPKNRKISFEESARAQGVERDREYKEYTTKLSSGRKQNAGTLKRRETWQDRSRISTAGKLERRLEYSQGPNRTRVEVEPEALKQMAEVIFHPNLKPF